MDWIGCFLIICLVGLLAVVGMVILAALWPEDRVYFSTIAVACV